MTVKLESDASFHEAGLIGPLTNLAFLLGDWQAESAAGGATGGFCFEARALGHVLLRTNYSDTPAAADRPASRHEDLMVIYGDENQALRGDYFDNEGHIIRYTGQVDAPGQVAFKCPPGPEGPGFRLSYSLEADGRLIGSFEFAPPGQPGQYLPYLTWNAYKLSNLKNKLAGAG